jgi:hypothetical protein
MVKDATRPGFFICDICGKSIAPKWGGIRIWDRGIGDRCPKCFDENLKTPVARADDPKYTPAAHQQAAGRAKRDSSAPKKV